ncbi:MAG: shikimate kinase [Myxococcota bacterium]
MDGYYDPGPRRRLRRHLCLSGFLGSGVGLLAHHLGSISGLRTVILKDFVCHRSGGTITQLITKVGENRYRDEETDALAHALRETSASVIALDEGTLERPDNVALIRKHADLLYVHYTVESLKTRIRRQMKQNPERFFPWIRPDSSDEAIEFLFAQREEGYDVAPVRVDADDVRNGELVSWLESRYTVVATR